MPPSLGGAFGWVADKAGREKKVASLGLRPDPGLGVIPAGLCLDAGCSVLTEVVRAGLEKKLSSLEVVRAGLEKKLSSLEGRSSLLPSLLGLEGL